MARLPSLRWVRCPNGGRAKLGWCAGARATLKRLALLAANKRWTARWLLRTKFARGSAQTPRSTGSTERRDARSREAMPAFDLKVCNPIHWPRDARAEVAVLGPPHLLRPGSKAQRAVGDADAHRLRRFHHVLDAPAFHGDVVARAAKLARLAAAGVVMHVADATPRLGDLLGAELHSLMTTDPSRFDAATRELHSIAMRRAALRGHAAWARQRSNLPSVSIVLASRRPALLPQALAAVQAQTWPRLELVLAPHGDMAAFAGIERRLAGLPIPTTLVPAQASTPLGAVLNAAVQASSGALVTKMDDDDRYGPEHVWDLALAHAYSGASLVCKGMEFVYLAAANRTLHCHRGRGEAWRASAFAGGTLMIARQDLDAIGGWRNAPAGVDWGLVEDVLRGGGAVYRIHGTGFMLVRHGENHTWGAGDGFFLERAAHSVPGWAPALAGLAEAPGAAAPAGTYGSAGGIEPPPARLRGGAFGMHTA